MSDTAIKSAYNAADTFFMTPAERMSYVNRQMAIMDYNSEMKHARDEGIAKGENRMGKLMAMLSTQNRLEDIKRASTNASFRKKLYKEYGIS